MNTVVFVNENIDFFLKTFFSSLNKLDQSLLTLPFDIIQLIVHRAMTALEHQIVVKSITDMDTSEDN